MGISTPPNIVSSLSPTVLLIHTVRETTVDDLDEASDEDKEDKAPDDGDADEEEDVVEDVEEDEEVEEVLFLFLHKVVTIFLKILY